MKILVIGGGVSGLAISCKLAKEKIDNVLMEKRPFLGGRAYSFYDNNSGEEIDNGQHIIVGACKEFIEFLSEINSTEKISFEKKLRIPVLKQKKISYIKSYKFPMKILGKIFSILLYKHLKVIERISLLRALYKLSKIKEENLQKLEEKNFYDWLLENHQNENTIESFWELFSIPALNDDLKNVSASIGIRLFQVAFIESDNNANFAIPNVGLTKLLGDSAENFLKNSNSKIIKNQEVKSLVIKNNKIKGVMTRDDQIINSDIVISTLPPNQFLNIIPEKYKTSFQKINKINMAPIIGIHLWFDKHFFTEKFMVVLKSPIQWIFNDSEIKNSNSNTQHIVISLSNAWEWKNKSKKLIKEIFISEINKLFPESQNCKLINFSVIKMFNATFRCQPGIQKIRPNNRTNITGLYLSGDWVQSDWPSTMEAAVISAKKTITDIKKDFSSII
ncbi:MAG: hydroxysqualene dehydroxylase HpnE [Dehalococcoidia bacterium]